MATGARCSSANREAQRHSDATNHSIVRTVRISQSHHRACPGWRDRIFSARFASPDRRRALPNFARRRQSRIGGIKGATTCARWALHAARLIRLTSLFSNKRRGRKCIARFNRQACCAESGTLDRCLLRRRIFAKALLDKFERVIGIDWDRFAIAAAKENASPKETYIAGDV